MYFFVPFVPGPLFPTLPMEVGTVNVSRIPSSICKQLLKLKAKFQTTETKQQVNPSSLVIPEGYYLVEFFGTHDFGWLKQEATMPMTSDGLLSDPTGKLGTFARTSCACCV